MITEDYLQDIENLYIEGLPKDKARTKFLNKWRRENVDVVWKEETLAKKTFEAQWSTLENWSAKRVVQEKRKRVLEELSKEEGQYE